MTFDNKVLASNIRARLGALNMTAVSWQRKQVYRSTLSSVALVGAGARS